MAAARDTHKAFVFNVYEDRLLAKNSRNNRAVVAKRTHSGLDLISALFKHYELALVTRIFDILSEIEGEFSIEIDEDSYESFKTIKDVVEYIENAV